MKKNLAEIWQRLAATPEELARWCTRRRVRKFAVFGSVLYRGFPDASDINVLLVYAPGAAPGDADGRGALAAELETLLGRRVTVVDEERIEAEEPSLFRRISVLGTAQPLYQRPPGADDDVTAELDACLEGIVGDGSAPEA